MRVKNYILASVALAAISFTTSPARALSNDSDVAELKAELAELKAKLAALTEKVDDNSEKAKPASAPEVKWKGAPELKDDDGWSFKPRGRIQYDFGTVDAPNSIIDPGLGFANEARRIRLGASGKIPGGFGYKLEADFTDGVVLTDAFFTYKDKGLTITLGQQNPFQGLEELSSSNDTSFIERSAFTDAFPFERNVGISAQYKTGDILLQAGVFTDNIEALNDDGNNSIGFDGRIVAAPKIGNVETHFGASYHYRDLGDAINSRRFRQRPLAHFTDTRFIDTGAISNATSETNYGLEAAVIAGRFHAAAETHWLNLKRTGFADPTFFGGSVEAGIFLTDDKRRFKNGTFGSIDVSNPVGDGGFGALQFNVRYDHLDLVDAGVVGGIQDSYQASLIWTPVNYVRFLVNYARLDYDQASVLAAGSGDYNVDVFAGRFQLSF